MPGDERESTVPAGRSFFQAERVPQRLRWFQVCSENQSREYGGETGFVDECPWSSSLERDGETEVFEDVCGEVIRIYIYESHSHTSLTQMSL